MKPILFSTPMVQAILEGRKTMTRREVKKKFSNTDIQWKELHSGRDRILVEMQNDTPPPVKNEYGTTTYKLRAYMEVKCPYGQIGDVLWVREKFRKHHPVDESGYIDFETTIVEYAADNPEPLYLTDGDGFVRTNKDGSEKFVPFKPSIHMPKDACRLFLQITNIRVERLQEVSEADAIAEGWGGISKTGDAPLSWFYNLWQLINGPGSWEANPWVWVVEFKQIDKPKAI